MNSIETLKLAVGAISANKLRSSLTLLGMIIGVTSFMVVLSLLQGFNAYVDEKIAGIGSNSFTLRRFAFDDFKDTDTIAAAQRRNKELTLDELSFIRERANVIDKIAAKALPTVREIKANGITLRDVRIDGAEPLIGEIEKLDIAEGRYFTANENSNSVRVCYIGMDVANKLFPYGDAIGGEIRVEGIAYRVIGVQTAKGTVFGQPQDNFIQMPLNTYGLAFGGFRGGRGLYFVGTSTSDATFDEAVEEARTLMRIKRKLRFDVKDTFGILTPDAITGIRDRILGPTFLVIMLVPAIALVVGAIVIMNIMLVAVTERTKEIGIRMSFGARRSDILRQFLFESAVLSAVGGVIGLCLAYLLGLVLTKFVFQTQIPLWSAAVAIAVAGGVGVVAGLFPAWKASKLDPVEAMRAE
jgi:putative ABC transport system permease protein